MVTTPRFRIHEEPRGDDRPLDNRFPARVGRTLESWKSAASESMGRNPLVTVAAGLALGVALGWLIKRR